MRRIFCVASWLLVIHGMTGCTTGNDPVPPTATVTGMVTLDGKPMAEGSIAFEVPGQPPKDMDIKDGTFSGEAFVGNNKVHATMMKDGPPSTTDPDIKTQFNAVAEKFSGANTTLSAEVMKTAANEFKFAVTSAPAAGK
jgi:hypothetical protein